MNEAWLQQVESDANAPTAKIFCADCVFYQRSSGQGCADDACLHPSARLVRESYHQRSVTLVRPSERNAYNQCPDYEQRTLAGEWRVMREQGDIPALSMYVATKLIVAIALVYAVGWLMTH